MENYLADVTNSIQTNETVNGVKGDCLLNRLKYFNAVESTCIDYMHSVLEGVVKNFFNYWFNSKISCEYSLANKMQEIDKRLLKIKPPKYVPCTPRTIYSHNLWRAHEYSTFILFYALPVLNGLMEEKFYENIKKLVIIIENLLLPQINIDLIMQVEKLVYEFLQELEIIYAKNIMLSGAHELLHLVDCTISFGPLNSINCFQFEELNRKLLGFSHGYDLIGEEILKIFSSCKFILKYTDKINNPKIKEFILQHLNFKSSNKKRLEKTKNTVLLSKPQEIEKEGFSSIFEYFYQFKNPLNFYSKLIFNGVYYSSYLISTKRCDSSFITSKGQSGLIEKFIKADSNLYVYAKKIIEFHNPFFSISFPNLQSKLCICMISNEYFIEDIKNIKKTFLIKIADNRYFLSCFSVGHLFN